MRIGIIGLGNLGLPLAVNLVRGGHDVNGFDLKSEAREEFAAYGGRVADAISDSCEGAEAVFTVLPDAPDVERAALGEQGILDSISLDAIYVDMSTVDPLCTRRVGAAFARKGIEMVDAPVARTLAMAWEGRSLLMLGGNPDAIARLRPALDAISESTIYCGPLGTGAASKLTNNFIANGILAVTVEALAIAIKSGIELEKVLEIVGKTGTFNKVLLENLAGNALKGEFAPGFRSALARKDQRLAMGLANSLGVQAPVGAATLDVLNEVAAAYPDLDFTAALKLREDQAGFVARIE